MKWSWIIQDYFNKKLYWTWNYLKWEFQRLVVFSLLNHLLKPVETTAFFIFCLKVIVLFQINLFQKSSTTKRANFLIFTGLGPVLCFIYTIFKRISDDGWEKRKERWFIKQKVAERDKFYFKQKFLLQSSRRYHQSRLSLTLPRVVRIIIWWDIHCDVRWGGGGMKDDHVQHFVVSLFSWKIYK